MLQTTSWRYLLRHPWQIGLCILGVALGVAVVVAIDLANASASRAFTLSTESVAGRATHQIVGGPTGLAEDLYREIRLERGLRQSAPVVDGYATAPAFGDLTVQLLGVDPLAEAPFRSYLGAPTSGDRSARDQLDLAALLVEPNTVLLAESTANRFALTVGSQFALSVGSRSATVRVIGLLRPSDDLSRQALENLLITDVATAQELLGSLGRLSRIDLILTPDQVAQLTAALPPNTALTRAGARTNALDQMTKAFELNLTALSLLALVVGMFLIYNTITFSVVQRRTLLGTLRCIGVTQAQIFGLVLTEALIVSLVGSLAGLGLGIVLGRGLVVLVTQTINDLYFVVTVRELSIEPWVLVKGMGLGLGATMLAAAVPALEAMLTPPRTVLRRSSVEESVRRIVPLAALAGGLLAALGVGLLLLPSPSLVLAFAGLFAIVLGCALLTPLLAVLVMTALRPLLGAIFGMLGRMASRDAIATLSRTAVAVAALMVAISVTIGVGIMVGSFRGTVVAWLNQSLVADVYISPPASTSTRVDSTLDLGVRDALLARPEVADYTIFRSVEVETPSGPTSLEAIFSTTDRGRQGVRFQAGDGDAAWAGFDAGGVLISEPLAYRTGLSVGDSLTLRTDRGPHAFPIIGVNYDYTSDRGVIRMADATYRAFWDDTAISSMALYTRSGVDVDALVQTLRTELSPWGAIAVSSNQGLRAGALAVFDRTFAITGVLQLLATIVAFIGVLSALMALQLERARELGMLRANGLTPAQLWGLILTQTGLMGLTAGVLAAPVGWILALVLVYVINRRSFGWTLDMAIDPLIFAQALGVALVAALLAGVYPAFRMSKMSPGLAMRED